MTGPFGGVPRSVGSCRVSLSIHLLVEVTAEQGEHATVREASSPGAQPVLRNRVKYPASPRPQSKCGPHQSRLAPGAVRLASTSAGNRSLLRELVLEDRFDYQPQGRLHDRSPHRRNTQRALLVRAGLRNPDPFHRLGLIARRAQLLFQVEQTARAVFGEACHRDTVHAAATCVGPHLCPSQLQRPVRIDFVHEAEPLFPFTPLAGLSACAPSTPRVPLPPDGGRVSSLFSPRGALSEVGFPLACSWRVHLPGSLAPRRYPAFIATMDPLTPARISHPCRSLHLSHAPFRSFPLQPHPSRPGLQFDSSWTVSGSPLARQASPFPSRLARLTCRIEFTFVRDQPSASGCSPPRLAATQLPSAASRSLSPGGR